MRRAAVRVPSAGPCKQRTTQQRAGYGQQNCATYSCAVPYVVKPFNAATLKEKIDKIIAKKGLA